MVLANDYLFVQNSIIFPQLFSFPPLKYLCNSETGVHNRQNSLVKIKEKMYSNNMISIDTLQKIAEALDVSVDDLIKAFYE